MEKFMRKMWKKSEGFTLVELIVVIAILGILAAVAVPAYSGYIKKAEQSADLQVLGSVANAVAGVYAAEGKTVSKMEVTNTKGTDSDAKGVITVYLDGSATGTALPAGSDAWKLMGITDTKALDKTLKADWATATMTGGEWTLQ